MSLLYRAGVVTLVASALLTAGCAADADDDAATASAAPSVAAEESAPAEEETGPVAVPDVTHLILETASGNLMRAGLETEIVDEAGAPVVADDLTAWTVSAQDPADGELERGAVVTLTVTPRG